MPGTAPKILCTRRIDLAENARSMPEHDKYKLSENSEALYVYPDMHGNFWKMFEGVMTHTHVIECDEFDHDSINASYRLWKSKGKLDKDALESLRHTIYHGLHVNKDAVGCLLFIGDVFSDRGPHDLPTLQFNDLLVRKGVYVLNTLSNHDSKLIKIFERLFNLIKDYGSLSNYEAWYNSLDVAQAKNYLDPKKYFIPTGMSREHTNSLHAVQESIEEKAIVADDVFKLYQSYIKTSRILTYSIIKNSKGQEIGITLYTHGVVGLRTVFAIAKKLGIIPSYTDCEAEVFPQYDTPSELAKLIDAINLKWQEHLEAGTATSLFDEKYLTANGACAEAYPLEHIMWAREDESKKNTYIYRPEKFNGFDIYYVHGHDNNALTNGHCINLEKKHDDVRNNFLGAGKDFFQGESIALYSTEIPAPKLALLPKEEKADAPGPLPSVSGKLKEHIKDSRKRKLPSSNGSSNPSKLFTPAPFPSAPVPGKSGNVQGGKKFSRG